MAQLILSNISHSFGTKTTLENVTVKVEKGEKIGFVGRNGTGKSTLLKIITGKLDSDSGTVIFESGTTMGYLEQELDPSLDCSVFETVLKVRGDLLSMEKRLEELQKQMASDEYFSDPLFREKISEEYHTVETRYEQEEGYRLIPLARSILNGLGFSDEQIKRNVQGFSGGEKNLILLSRILLSEPDLILLDEPANHMDFDRIEWLEGYLSRCKSSFILVSHNRFLLDRCVDKIWELENCNITEYTGNYTEYRTEKTILLEQQKALYEKTQKKIQSLLFTAQRLASWGMVYDNPKLAKKAQIIRKRIEKMESSAPPPVKEGKSIGLRFFKYTPKSTLALEIKNFSFSFPDSPPLLNNISLFLRSGERIALLGKNGSGKTTLFNSIWENGNWHNPVIRIGKNVNMAYYSQIHSFIDPEKSILDNLMSVKFMSYSEASKILFSLLFTVDDLDRSAKTLSGGEKGRLQLARILVLKPDFLLMDEPTNHLDIPSREVMEEALADYQGTLMVISHDQYFLDRMVDRLCFIQNGALSEFRGNYSEFYDIVHFNRLKKKEMNEEEKRASKIITRKDNLRYQRELKNYNREKKVFTDKIKIIEESICTFENQLKHLELSMAEEYENGNFEKGNNISIHIDSIKKQIETEYQNWENAQKDLEFFVESNEKSD